MGQELRAPVTAVLGTGVLLAVSLLGYVANNGVPAAFGHPDRATHHRAEQRPPTRTVTESVTYRPGSVLALRPGFHRVAGPGDRGDAIRDLQVRLRHLAWYAGTITGVYDRQTHDGVAGFQAKRGLRATGVVNGFTRDRLHTMTSTPSAAEKQNKVASSTSTDARLDARCTTGRVLCIDKTSQTVRWVVGGRVQATMAVRFGAAYTPTREGLFSVQRKSRDHVSTLFHTAMPFAMFFSGGQAVHYSSDFAARGYAGASHGCVNVRDYDGVRWLFDQVDVGDRVVVYRS